MKTTETQSLAQNIGEEIDNKIIIIFGKMRNGKTLLAINIALEYYPRIYSNVNIYHEGKSILTSLLTDYKSIESIRFSYTPGVIIIDESGINANSKDGMAGDSRLLERVLFLSGKKNCSLIWISQRLGSINVNARQLCDLFLEVKKIRRYGRHPLFNISRVKPKGLGSEEVNILTQWKFDIIGYMRQNGITYNTLEESILEKTPRKEKKEE